MQSFRRSLLAKHPRHKAVFEAAASRAGWDKPLAKGRARGIAVHESFNTFVAQVVEVSRSENAPCIERVVCAVDCGVAVNPNIIAMQMESGIGYGLSAALAGAITLKDGAVEQSNFHDYPVVRMNQMPRIETVIVPSQEEADRGRRALDARDRAGARRRVPCAERQAGAGVTAFRAGNYLRLVRMALRPVHVAVLDLFRRRRAHFEHFAAQLGRTCARPPQFLDLCR